MFFLAFLQTDDGAAQFYNIDFDVEKLKRGVTATVQGSGSAASRKQKLLGRRRQASMDNEAKASVLLQVISVLNLAA